MKDVSEALAIPYSTVSSWRQIEGLPPRFRVDPDRVPNETLRARVTEAGIPLAEIASRCGWKRANGKSDDTRVRVLLGLKLVPCTSSDKRYPRRAMPYTDALAICRALHVAPREVGL